jgi:hypothetical protein
MTLHPNPLNYFLICEEIFLIFLISAPFTCGLVILVDLPDISTMLRAFLAVSLALKGLTLTATYSRGYKNRATV